MRRDLFSSTPCWTVGSTAFFSGQQETWVPSHRERHWTPRLAQPMSPSAPRITQISQCLQGTRDVAPLWLTHQPRLA